MVPDEETLIEAVMLGNANAYKVLVDNYKDMVFTLCVSMVKDSMLAEELSQDAFLKAYRSIRSYRKESKFSTWLYSIAYNSCLSALRKKKVSEVDIQDLQIKGGENSGLRSLEERDRNDQLKDALNTLKEEEQLFIQLFYLEELSIKEIAEVTGASESNVKVKLHRSKQKLKVLIEDSYPELKRNVV